MNALSARLDVTVAQGDTLHRQRYHRGVPAGPLRATPARMSRSGTTVQFLADSSIFESLEYDATTLAERFREMAYLNADLRITLRDKRPGRAASSERFQFKTGIEAFVQHRNAEHEVLHPRPLVFHGERAGDQAEVALQYHAGFSEDSHSFANGIRTADGGTHMTGFRSALTRVVNEYARRARLLKDDEPNLSGEDTREGLTTVVSVRLREPQFEGQTKGRLGNPETKTLVESTVATQLATLFAERPRVARRARDLVQRKSLIEHSALPGKLADCSGTNPEDCEIYLVEGESAGGTARSARDRRYQAILPLCGKILNVEKARHEKMLEHEEIRAIITALGAGFGEHYGASRLRYHKVVIMTDADVDGAHIRTLLLTCFWRHHPVTLFVVGTSSSRSPRCSASRCAAAPSGCSASRSGSATQPSTRSASESMTSRRPASSSRGSWVTKSSRGAPSSLSTPSMPCSTSKPRPPRPGVLIASR